MAVDTAGPTSDSAGKPALHASFTNLISLVISPALSVRITYFYAGLPLHYIASGWPLTSFGVTLSAACLIRSFVFTPLYGQLGPWVMMPATAFHLCVSVPMAIWPSSFAAVTLGLFGAFTCHFLEAWQGLSFSRFEDPQLRSQASRTITLADTIGFGMAPFVGGLLYDAGGWDACAVFQLVLCCAELVLVWSNPLVRADFQRWWLARQVRKQETAVVPVTTEDGSQQTECPLKCCLKQRKSTITETSGVPRNIRWPALLIALISGLNTFVYVIEWALFAVYFRQEFNWQSAWWAGAAQMSGDVTGAMILLAVSKLKGSSQCSGTGFKADCYLLRLFRAPYHISLLLLCWAACHFLLASPIFAVAVAAQVIMGTLFVFTYQFLVEMLQLYAGTDLKLYLRLQCLAATCFAVGVSGATTFATWAYVTFGRKVPFFIASAVAFTGFAVYTLGFLVRVGVPQSLKDFEEAHRLRQVVPAAVSDTVMPFDSK